MSVKYRRYSVRVDWPVTHPIERAREVVTPTESGVLVLGGGAANAEDFIVVEVGGVFLKFEPSEWGAVKVVDRPDGW
jgi:hypothetical protein